MDWIFKDKHCCKSQETTRKNIVERMDKAIEEFKIQSEARKNAIRTRAVRHLEAYLDEIADYVLENMSENSMKMHSKPYLVSEVLGIKEQTFDNCDLMALRGKANLFGEFLCSNKLTMAVNDDYTKVKFAYGRYSMFESGWNEWAGYDYC